MDCIAARQVIQKPIEIFPGASLPGIGYSKSGCDNPDSSLLSAD